MLFGAAVCHLRAARGVRLSRVPRGYPDRSRRPGRQTHAARRRASSPRASSSPRSRPDRVPPLHASTRLRACGPLASPACRLLGHGRSLLDEICRCVGAHGQSCSRFLVTLALTRSPGTWTCHSNLGLPISHGVGLKSEVVSITEQVAKEEDANAYCCNHALDHAAWRHGLYG